MHQLLCWHRPRFERGHFRDPEAALVDVRELLCVMVAVAIWLEESCESWIIKFTFVVYEYI